MRTLLPLALLAGLALADGRSIRWHFPHEFEEARARSRDESRILLEVPSATSA
ncbi:MAG: hypothetical protein L6Q95_13100 [Planctomycetes bacterium]|nr:hypothetical protein [Planctomycetota bacterium]